eukprot:SAG31_NODE_1152_length_9642_cov_4.124489_10_plen_74_part_00
MGGRGEGGGGPWLPERLRVLGLAVPRASVGGPGRRGACPLSQNLLRLVKKPLAVSIRNFKLYTITFIDIKRRV